jgi:hypothetical protein
MSLNIHEVFEPAPLKNFLLVVRSKGNIPCKFCAMATPVVNYFNSRLPREIGRASWRERV